MEQITTYKEFCEALLPCPYCGSEASPHIHERYGVECNNATCGMGLACICDTMDEAVKRWNRRDPINKILGYLEQERSKPMELVYDVPLLNSVIDVVKKVNRGYMK